MKKVTQKIGDSIGEFKHDAISNIIAGIALLIGVINGTFSFYNYYIGAEVTQGDLRYAQFECFPAVWNETSEEYDICHQDASLHIRAGIFSFINNGQPGYNGIVEDISLKISFFDDDNKLIKESDYYWLYIADQTSAGYNETNAKPLLVPGKGVTGKEITFEYASIYLNNGASRKVLSMTNKILWQEFISLLKNTYEIELKFKAKLVDEKDPLEKQCRIFIDEAIISNLQTEKERILYFVRDCNAEPINSDDVK